MIRTTIGPNNGSVFFGILLDLLLFGILTGQIYIYYISFPKDRAVLKAVVVWVYLAGVTQTGLALLDFYNTFLGRLSSAVELRPDHLYLSITASTAAVAVVIQSLYAYRIYLISKKRWLTILIICMSLGQLASGILGTICYIHTTTNHNSLRLPNLALLVNHTCVFGFDWLWGFVNVSCDLTITVCMVNFLICHRGRTVSHRTRSHITKVIQIVVETGMVTTILMVVYTILHHSKAELWAVTYELPGLLMSKAYSNSMLVLLNNRATIVNGRNAVESFEFLEVSGQGLEIDVQRSTAN